MVLINKDQKDRSSRIRQSVLLIKTLEFEACLVRWLATSQRPGKPTWLAWKHHIFSRRKWVAIICFLLEYLFRKRNQWNACIMTTYLILRGYYRMSKRSNLQHIVTSLLISSSLTWIKRSMLAAALYRKKLKQVHRKTNPEKLERHGNKPSAISQSYDHISMLSRVNKKTDRYPERIKN